MMEGSNPPAATALVIQKLHFYAFFKNIFIWMTRVTVS